MFVQLLNYVLGPIQAFPTFFAGMMSANSLIDKLALALHQNISNEGEQIPPQLNEGISVKELAFAYEEGKPVLCSVDMELRAGGCYALMEKKGHFYSLYTVSQGE